MPVQRARGTDVPAVPEHVTSWWLGVLEGAAEGSHPVFGNTLEAKLEEQTLVVTGALPSEAGLRDLELELRLVAKDRQLSVRNNATVAPEGMEEHGVLEQTLMAIYDQELHAKLAIEQVQKNPLLPSVHLQLLGPGGNGDLGTAATFSRRLIGPTYQRELQRALEAGNSVVIATVDEADAFALRELMDEDTRSLRVLVLPPIIAAAERQSPDSAQAVRQ